MKNPPYICKTIKKNTDMKNKSLKTNKQGLTFIAECLNMTLMRLITFYITSDDFKDMVDKTVNELNPRRVKNGLEKLDVNKLILDLAEQK